MGIQYLLFDLDETLYTDQTGLFSQVAQRIVTWVSQTLNLSAEEASVLRREYNRLHGTTMAGLRVNHPEVDIDDYLDFVHDVNVDLYLQPDPALAAMLGDLAAPKVVFTNSTADWAERITRRLGVRHYFESIFDVRAAQYHSKPHPFAFAQILKVLQTSAERCVMIDDQPSYLAGARTAGFRTLLVRRDALVDGFDAAVSHVLEAGPILKGWLNAQPE